MTGKEKLGIYWGPRNIHFVETENNVPKQLIGVPIKLASPAEGDKTGAPSPDTIRDLIQATLREHHITSPTAYLTLPAKDIIFRTFIIPWMQSSEVKGVVEFEITKYVPFELNELAYNYYPYNFTENKKRQILIIFIGIKRTTLLGYADILQNSGVTIKAIESAPVSLLRILTLKKLFAKGKTTAVIESDENHGRILIVEKEAPLFFREFQLTIPADQLSQSEGKLETRLLNEVRISLEYFGRQYHHVKISQLLYVADNASKELSKNLQNYFNLPVSAINTNALVNNPNPTAMGLIHAFGASLRETVLPDVNFDFRWKPGEEEELAKLDAKPNYASVAITAVLCLGLLFFMSHLNRRKVTSLRLQADAITNQIGKNRHVDMPTIAKEITFQKEKLKSVNNIRTSSKISLVLNLLPRLMPSEIWITDFSTAYSESTARRGQAAVDKNNISLSFEANAYHSDRRRQLEIINQFVDRLKNDEIFSTIFKDVTLSSINQSDLHGYPITLFSVKCQ